MIEPSAGAPTALEHLRRLIENFLRPVEDKVYPGGCFYISVGAELGAQSGPVRDQAVALSGEWMMLLIGTIREAQGVGDIDAAEDAEQLAFELTGFLLLGNMQFVVTQSPTAIDRPPFGRSPSRASSYVCVTRGGSRRNRTIDTTRIHAKKRPSPGSSSCRAVLRRSRSSRSRTARHRGRR